MDTILAILFIVILCFIPVILNAGGKTVGAAAKAVVGKGSFKDNMNLAFKGMGLMEAKIETRNAAEDGPYAKELLVKGLFPVDSNTRVGFITSVLDDTGKELESVMSIVDNFQEPDNISYQCVRKLPDVAPDTGFINWVSVGVVFPEILIPPYSGTRSYMAVLRLVDLDEMPSIKYGFHQSDRGILWQRDFIFQHTFEEKGYKEASESREKSQELSIRIAMAVAMSDGSLDTTEGNVMKSWIEKNISIHEASKRNKLKSKYNKALKESYSDARSGDLNLSSLTSKLNKIAEKKEKYDTIELCYEVMAADGEAAKEEMEILGKISKALDLDFGEIQKIKDKSIVNLTSSLSKGASLEDMLDIDPSWDNATVRKHIRTEFQKWNNRVTTLPDGEERNNAQQMLDLLAEAKKKYG
jgi:tellurite resistance protein